MLLNGKEGRLHIVNHSEWNGKPVKKNGSGWKPKCIIYHLKSWQCSVTTYDIQSKTWVKEWKAKLTTKCCILLRIIKILCGQWLIWISKRELQEYSQLTKRNGEEDGVGDMFTNQQQDHPQWDFDSLSKVKSLMQPFIPSVWRLWSNAPCASPCLSLSQSLERQSASWKSPPVPFSPQPHCPTPSSTQQLKVKSSLSVDQITPGRGLPRSAARHYVTQHQGRDNLGHTGEAQAARKPTRNISSVDYFCLTSVNSKE